MAPDLCDSKEEGWRTGARSGSVASVGCNLQRGSGAVSDLQEFAGGPVDVEWRKKGRGSERAMPAGSDGRTEQHGGAYTHARLSAPCVRGEACAISDISEGRRRYRSMASEWDGNGWSEAGMTPGCRGDGWWLLCWLDLKITEDDDRLGRMVR